MPRTTPGAKRGGAISTPPILERTGTAAHCPPGWASPAAASAPADCRALDVGAV